MDVRTTIGRRLLWPWASLLSIATLACGPPGKSSTEPPLPVGKPCTLKAQKGVVYKVQSRKIALSASRAKGARGIGELTEGARLLAAAPKGALMTVWPSAVALPKSAIRVARGERTIYVSIHWYCSVYESGKTFACKHIHDGNVCKYPLAQRVGFVRFWTRCSSNNVAGVEQKKKYAHLDLKSYGDTVDYKEHVITFSQGANPRVVQATVHQMPYECEHP